MSSLSPGMARPATEVQSPQTRGRSFLSPILVAGYRIRLLRPVLRRAILLLEGGEMYSCSLRLILKKYYQVEAGMYSYGPCLKPGMLPPGTVVGRYSSFAVGINIFRRNHPKDRISTHPFFFNHFLGFLAKDTIEEIGENPLYIGHDVWIGYGATILPGCRKIGNGAIVGAGAVVTKDVTAFTVVGGNPAKVIAQRFSAEIAEVITRSEWWSKSVEDLIPAFPLFNQPMTSDSALQFSELLKDRANR
jgi:virginiamycin A acetyltransferase